jgi:hypothetical protein
LEVNTGLPQGAFFKQIQTESHSMVLPDYQGQSIVNLMASLITGLGGKPAGYPPLSDWPEGLLKDVRQVVLIVVDGLGYNYLLRQGADTTLASQVRSRMTSVFPSTTATAITSFYTGVAPQQHGLTGWHTYFRELGSVLAVLPGVARYGGVPLKKSGIPVKRFFEHRTVFDRLPVESHLVSPARIACSDFNLAHSGRAHITPYDRGAQFFPLIEQLVKRKPGRNFIYAYWPDFDHLCHESGSQSALALSHLQAFDTAYQDFLARIRGTSSLILVTADHGFIDTRVDRTLHLADHPRLAESLVLPLCGEPRLAYCYVKPRYTARFEQYIQTELAECMVLRDSQALLDQGYFGLGTPHPRLAERIGDYTLIMKDDWIIKDRLPFEKAYQPIGVHGGVDPDEMYVPLCWVRV